MHNFMSPQYIWDNMQCDALALSVFRCFSADGGSMLKSSSCSGRNKEQHVSLSTFAWLASPINMGAIWGAGLAGFVQAALLAKTMGAHPFARGAMPPQGCAHPATYLVWLARISSCSMHRCARKVLACVLLCRLCCCLCLCFSSLHESVRTRESEHVKS